MSKRPQTAILALWRVAAQQGGRLSHWGLEYPTMCHVLCPATLAAAHIVVHRSYCGIMWKPPAGEVCYTGAELPGWREASRELGEFKIGRGETVPPPSRFRAVFWYFLGRGSPRRVGTNLLP